MNMENATDSVQDTLDIGDNGDDGIVKTEITYDEVIMYLSTGKYPEQMPKDVKRRVREKVKAFAFEDGCLFHKSSKGKLGRVVTDDTEKDRIILNMHCGVGGAHFGQSATIIKVS
jgi:hypothetical protein